MTYARRNSENAGNIIDISQKGFYPSEQIVPINEFNAAYQLGPKQIPKKRELY